MALALPLPKTTGCSNCLYRGHNGGFAPYDRRLVICEAPGVGRGDVGHPDELKDCFRPKWCPLVEINSRRTVQHVSGAKR